MRTMKSLFHINIPANDWDKMVDFYVNKCGFDQAFIIHVSDMKKMFGKPVEEGDDKLPQITYIRVSPNSYIELVNAKVQGGEVFRAPESAFHHMAFLVDDLEATAREMAKAGCPLVESPINQTPISLDPFMCHEGEDGCRIAWMVDPEGHFIEVMQQSGNSMQEKFEREHPYAD